MSPTKRQGFLTNVFLDVEKLFSPVLLRTELAFSFFTEMVKIQKKSERLETF
jgi:hypothetical protein